MTDAEWQAAGWPVLFDALFPPGRRPRGKGIQRKLRLALCGAARLVWDKLPDDQCRRAVEVAEAFADGRATADELAAAERAVLAAMAVAIQARSSTALGGIGAALRRTAAGEQPVVLDIGSLLGQAGGIVSGVAAALTDSLRLAGGSSVARATTAARVTAATARHGLMQSLALFPSDDGADRLADVVRDVFVNPADPTAIDKRWRTRAAVGLAEGIAADAGFDRLPVLADALEEAGCDDRRVLDHCRGPGPHVRGCWVVDGVLGR